MLCCLFYVFCSMAVLRIALNSEVRNLMVLESDMKEIQGVPGKHVYVLLRNFRFSLFARV